MSMTKDGPAASQSVGPARISDVLSTHSFARVLGFLGALLVLAMLGMVGYEVLNRSFFGRPTFWVVEITTYVMVAMAFVGLSYAEATDSHLSVDFFVTSLPDRAQTLLQGSAKWIGLFFLGALTWQFGLHVHSEFVNDTRDWGLLSTPQWMPKTPIFVGLALFLTYSLLVETAHLPWLRKAIVLGMAVIIAALLTGFGHHPPNLPGTRFDAGIVLIAAGCFAGTTLVRGWRVSWLPVLVICVTVGVFWGLKGQSTTLVASVMGGLLLIYLALGIRIWVTLGLLGMMGLNFLLPIPQIAVIAERSWISLNTFTFTAVPMFLLMGNLMVYSGVTSNMFESFARWTGRMRGGLGIATITSSGVFAALSGSSLATAATIGQIAGPEMTTRGYSPRLAAGSIAGGGTLGILIPPSIPMIVYGSTVAAPITTLFIAGILPGLIMMLSMIAAILLWSAIVPGSAPQSRRYSLVDKLKSLTGTAPFVAIIVAVMLAIYYGIVTVTEAGALSAICSALLCFAYGKLTRDVILRSLLDTVKVTSYILIIVASAAILSWVVDYLGISKALLDYFVSSDLAPWAAILGIAVFYVFLGMFLDPVSMMLMTLPVTFPIVLHAGYDAIWFGVALMMLIEVGLITPPVGIVLFVLRGTLPDVSLKDIILGAIPFVFVILANVALIFLVPQVVSYLPSLMGR